MLLFIRLKVLVDDGDCQQDACARADGPHEICHNGQRSNAHASKGSRNWNVPVELLFEGLDSIPMSLQGNNNRSATG